MNNKADGKVSPKRNCFRGKFPSVLNDRRGDRIETFVPLLYNLFAKNLTLFTVFNLVHP